MGDNTFKDALPRLAEGIRKAASVVGPTMGPKGVNVTIQSKLSPGHLTTNDGATIIKAMELADPIEKIGLGFLKEAVERSNANSGDGSSTTTVLLNSIIQEGIMSGVATPDIKRSLDDCLPIIIKSLDEQREEITVEDIPAVARIAGENEEVAKTLGEIYRVIGKDGIIHLEGSGTYETSYSLIEGVRFGDTGYLSPAMATEKNKAIYHNPTILVTKRKISHIKEIDPLLQALVAAERKDLVIFTDDMDSDVARMLIELQKNPQRALNILIIKAPTLWKQYVFEDFAKVTGSTIVEDATGVTFKNLKLDHLGTCQTIIVDKEETTVIGIADITDHVMELQEEQTTDSKLRLSWLATKTAILKVGAQSETELSYKRLKYEDAIHSSRLALAHGVVPGGGIALKIASAVMPDTIGGRILMMALTRPIAQICQNMGIDIPESFGPEVIDSVDIVAGAVKNALGIASTVLTTSSVITLVPEPQMVASPFPFQ
jgi:chaperonin GroEL